MNRPSVDSLSDLEPSKESVDIPPKLDQLGLEHHPVRLQSRQDVDQVRLGLCEQRRASVRAPCGSVARVRRRHARRRDEDHGRACRRPPAPSAAPAGGGSSTAQRPTAYSLAVRGGDARLALTPAAPPCCAGFDAAVRPRRVSGARPRGSARCETRRAATRSKFHSRAPPHTRAR